MPYVASSRTGLLGVEDDQVRAAAMGDVQGSLTALGARALRAIAALEAEKARLEARLLSAYGALHTIEAQQIATLSAARGSLHVTADRVVTEEIALATGVGTGEVSRRLALATAPRRHRAVLAALRAGHTSLHRALQVASETAPLCDADVAVVEESVLRPARDEQPVAQRTFVTRLRRAVASVDRRGTAERHAHARARRGLFGRLTEDGMGCLTVTTDAATAAAVLDHLDASARSLRGSGDPRTLDQLRCDLATEALLRGHLGARATPTATGGPTGEAAGLVWLVVPFEVATGDSNAACELPGHGWLTATHAREVMTRPGSIWRTLPVDVRTGQAISRPTRSHRPTRAMVEHVQAVDGSCRGPGCEVVATRCDLDHETPWPTGQTRVGNLFNKHRLHHNVKTDGIWNSEAVAGDGLHWTTLTGRTYTTRPKDWREGLDPPPEADLLPEPDPPAGRWTDDDIPPF
ncbi:HNH endonuclease [Terrabacter sp. MAHUQ-38]|uniref:HNH endonuclease n=1 Tax=unclassified Terrabacter TaxID=2630222 RepID=UPI00165DEF14|nr:HNH endonuclease [Terrabacter sp. MAHUQ-38]MBC9820711.1 HNH endonuclease [Terrabacter sp. MAHUQ-38]